MVALVQPPSVCHHCHERLRNLAAAAPSPSLHPNPTSPRPLYPVHPLTKPCGVKLSSRSPCRPPSCSATTSHLSLSFTKTSSASLPGDSPCVSEEV